MNKVLVAYASKLGSTKEVAESIAETLRNDDIDAVAKSLDSVANVKEFDGVIVGAPINGMRWRQDAVDFIGIHQEDLREKTVAYFSLSYTVVLGRKMWKKQIEKAFDGVIKQTNPIQTASFGGRVDDELPGVVRFIFGMPKDAPSDQRDWDQISAWARAYADKL